MQKPGANILYRQELFSILISDIDQKFKWSNQSYLDIIM